MYILKDIPGYEGLYKASSDGHIWSCGRRIFLKERESKDGYRVLGLTRDKKQRKFFVHRLIAMTFVPNPENKETVNHINEIKNDNRVENLEWMTNLENVFYGTGQQRAIENSRKADNWWNETTSKKVYQLSLEGELVKVHRSIYMAAKSQKIAVSTIRKCLKGIQKTCHGFRWQLAN